MDGEEMRKRRITDFFARHPSSQAKSDGRLKCPKTKIFGDVGGPSFGISSGCNNNNDSNKRVRLFVKADDLSQMTLDAGQRIIGTVSCSECGMVYSVDSVWDKQNHDKYHHRLNNTDLHVGARKFDSWASGETEHRIAGSNTYFFVNATSSSSLKALVDEAVVNLVNESVGYASHSDLWVAGRTVVACISTNRSRHRFLVGVVVFDELCRAVCETSGKEVQRNPSMTSSLVGVDRMWTHPRVRRQGIATTMLDVIANPNWPMRGADPRRRIAFTELTGDGRSLAVDWSKKQTCGCPNSNNLHPFVETEDSESCSGVLGYSDEDLLSK